MPNRLIMKKGCHVLNSTHSDVHVQSCAHVYQQTGLVCEPYPNYAFNFTKRTFQERSIENISATSCCPAPIARFVKQSGLLFWLAISLGRLRYVKMSKASSIWETTSLFSKDLELGMEFLRKKRPEFRLVTAVWFHASIKWSTAVTYLGDQNEVVHH